MSSLHHSVIVYMYIHFSHLVLCFCPAPPAAPATPTFSAAAGWGCFLLFSFLVAVPLLLLVGAPPDDGALLLPPFRFPDPPATSSPEIITIYRRVYMSVCVWVFVYESFFLYMYRQLQLPYQWVPCTEPSETAVFWLPCQFHSITGYIPFCYTSH